MRHVLTCMCRLDKRCRLVALMKSQDLTRSIWLHGAALKYPLIFMWGSEKDACVLFAYSAVSQIDCQISPCKQLTYASAWNADLFQPHRQENFAIKQCTACNAFASCHYLLLQIYHHTHSDAILDESSYTIIGKSYQRFQN